NALTDCDDDATRQLFESGVAPPEAYLDWRLGHFRDDGYSDVYEQAVMAVISRATAFDADAHIRQLARFRAPRSARTMIALHDRARDPKLRHLIALHLEGQPHPRAAALYQAACNK